MFWAFLWFFDFRIGVNNVHIDVLPDIIGWLLIGSALGWIVDVHPSIRGIRTLAYVLGFLALFDVVEVRLPLESWGSIKTWYSPTFPVGILATVLDVVLIWKLCGVIMDMAVFCGNPVIRDRAWSRRQMYLAFEVVVWLAVGLIFAAPHLGLIVILAGIPVALIIFCLMMGLMKGTGNMWREAGPHHSR